MEADCVEKLCEKQMAANEQLARECPVFLAGYCWAIPMPGWIEPVSAACRKIEAAAADARKSGLIVTASQVKEKFGGLRLYYDVARWQPNPVRRWAAAFLDWLAVKLEWWKLCSVAEWIEWPARLDDVETATRAVVDEAIREAEAEC